MENIKQLRERTGAGIIDCKKALEEANGNPEEAIEILRKKGISKAAKRADAEANEGIIKLATNEEKNEGYILEVNSETDFVAKNEQFQNFADQVIKIIQEKKPANLEELLSLGMGDNTIKENLEELSGTIKEKLVIGKFDILQSPTVASYSHMGGKIGALVGLDKEGEHDLAADIAMQVAAAEPKYLKPEEVPQEEIDKEKAVYKEQLKQEGKPENIIDKIVEGKINKYFSEVCLIKQEFIKDDKKTVEQILGDIGIERFIRYSL